MFHSSDGGGIRGLATLHQISEIMREVNKDTRSELRPCDVFDVIAGVGVGGVTLTRTQILGGAGGAFTDTSIVIDTLLIPGFAAGDTVKVRADGRLSNTFTAT